VLLFALKNQSNPYLDSLKDEDLNIVFHNRVFAQHRVPAKFLVLTEKYGGAHGQKRYKN
jgi:hypothetical protein